MGRRRFLRNWLWPAVGAVGAAVAESSRTMLDACGTVSLDCIDHVRLGYVAGAALLGFLYVKFNGLGGKDQGWFSHDRGDGFDPHRA